MAGLFDDLPQAGDIPGKLHTDDAIAPKVRGAARPFAPGEWVDNPDGSWSSEISATVTHPALNKGQPTNIPTLWLIDGKPVRVSDDQAAQLAAKSGLSWPAYASTKDADAAATEREKAWQGLKPEQASKVPPLWTAAPDTPQDGASGFRGFGGR